MTNYVLNYADGRTHEIVAANDDAAIRTVHTLLGEEIVLGDWDADGHNDDDEAMERMLIWDNEEDAENDPGVRSIAYLSAVRDR